MLDALRSWAEIEHDSIAAHGMHLETSMGGDSPNPGMRLDFDSTQFIGRITCWESGECELELIDVDTEETIYSENQTLTMTADFADAFRDFLRVMSDST